MLAYASRSAAYSRDMNLQLPRLTHSSDADPGYTRRRCGRGFAYLDTRGRPLRSPRTMGRIRALAIPPAWQSVWICASSRGHIQATGIDSKGRKQYLYHRQWAALRDQRKYQQLANFGKALPRLRRRLRADLEAPEGSLQCTLAAVVSLLDRSHLRIGSQQHLRQNGTYGAATLLGRHIRFLDDGELRLDFRGKGGRRVRLRLRDRRLHQILQRIDDLPGQRLFSYIGAEGKVCPVTSQQINAYIADTCGGAKVTAKTFRTWAGSVTALERVCDDPSSGTIRNLSEAAAERLHNTPAICRSSYIHPSVLDLVALEPARWPKALRGQAPAKPSGLSVGERRLLALLECKSKPGA